MLATGKFDDLVRVICDALKSANAKTIKIILVGDIGTNKEVVTGCRYHEEATADITIPRGKVEPKLLESFVKKLLGEGDTFTVKNGSTIIRWTINKNFNQGGALPQ